MVPQGLKLRILDRLKPYAGKWVKELSSVLWALCMTLSCATGHTTFSLVYGFEAMLPPRESVNLSEFSSFLKSSQMTPELMI
jgi:hypothetical protein